MPRDERRMTFIVVPHGGRDLSTRSFEISYRRLRIVGGLLLAAVIAWVLMLISWFFLAAQAARVSGLQREVRALEEDREQVVQLAEALRRMEIQYAQVRRMLGAAGDADSVEVWLPPAAEQQAP
jgi:hypothetical protein